jgi:hypothetical protein
MVNRLWGRDDELGKVGMQSHVAVLCLVNVREFVEQRVLWTLAVYGVVLFTVCRMRQRTAKVTSNSLGSLNSNTACRASTCTSSSWPVRRK